MQRLNYSLKIASIPSWKVTKLKPTVVLIQLKATYCKPEFTDGLIKHEDNPAYFAKLIGAIQSAIEMDAQFIVLPEYALPRSAVSEVVTILHGDLRNNSVCILPLEHMSLAEYREVLTLLPLASSCSRSITREINSLAQTGQHTETVNVSVTFVKTKRSLAAIPQLKLRPAAAEEVLIGASKFCGGSVVRIVKGANCRFATTICFDFIAKDDSSNTRPRNIFANSAINFLFVPECNPEPLHELYAKAVIDMYEDVTWTSKSPLLIFCNVAEQTASHWEQPSSFGFSRIIGDLGQTEETRLNSHRTQDGIILAKGISSLRGLGNSVVNLSSLKSIVIRPQESLAKFECPKMGQKPSKDPSGGRFTTHVEVFRYVGSGTRSWYPIRQPRKVIFPQPMTGVPTALVEAELVGIETIQSEFLLSLRKSVAPLWIIGDGGSGKTALVAKLIWQHVQSCNTPVLYGSTWHDLTTPLKP